jgi:hypothetical protein
MNRTKPPFWKSSGTGTNQGLDSWGHYEALNNSALSAFRQICKTISFSTSIRLLLPMFWAVSVSADTGGEQKPTPQTQYDPDLPRWFYPALFAMIGLYVEGAGRYYNERHKWYTMFMAVANLAFPWLVEHDDVSPSLTCRYDMTDVFHETWLPFIASRLTTPSQCLRLRRVSGLCLWSDGL